MHDAGCPDVPFWVESAHERAVADGHRNAVAAYAARVLGEDGVRRYGKAAAPRLRSVDRDLEVWDCVSCNLCVTVCPNDAMLHLASPDGAGFGEKWQYFCLAELCNDCGNCTTFCPERGDPSRVKPRMFLDAARFGADTGPAYLVTTADGRLVVTGSPAVDPRDLGLVTALVTAAEGLPIRPGDLG